MKRLVFTVALLCILSGVLYAQQMVTIEYVDLEGNIRQVLASNDERIVVFRNDGSVEVDLMYERATLKRASVRRDDGSVEADVLYDSAGNLQSITARRQNSNAEAHIVYQGGKLSDVASFRADNTLEAIIGYKDGALDHISVANPDRAQTVNEQRQIIEFFPSAQLLVRGEELVCAVN